MRRPTTPKAPDANARRSCPSRAAHAPTHKPAALSASLGGAVWMASAHPQPPTEPATGSARSNPAENPAAFRTAARAWKHTPCARSDWRPLGRLPPVDDWRAQSTLNWRQPSMPLCKKSRRQMEWRLTTASNPRKAASGGVLCSIVALWGAATPGRGRVASRFPNTVDGGRGGAAGACGGATAGQRTGRLDRPGRSVYSLYQSGCNSVKKSPTRAWGWRTLSSAACNAGPRRCGEHRGHDQRTILERKSQGLWPARTLHTANKPDLSKNLISIIYSVKFAGPARP